MNAPAAKIIGPAATETRAAALEYVRRGWHPIPVRPPEAGNADSGKAPIPARWQTLEVGEADLPRLFPKGTRRNIGINCKPSGLVVLDFDEGAAYSGWASKHPQAAKSYTVRRSNAEPGRCHIYFQLRPDETPPAQLTKKATGWGDLKSAGGQVVAPPSIHYTGGRYEVIIAGDALPWRPEYVPEPFARPEARAPAPHKTTPSRPAPQSGGPGIPPSVQNTLDFGAPEGERNAAAFECAIQLRDEGHPEGAALSILRQFAGRCTPPLSDAELARTVRSAYQKPAREPARNPNAPAKVMPAPARQAQPTAAAPAGAGRVEAAPAPAEQWQTPAPLGELSILPPVWPWEVYPATLRELGAAIVSTMNLPDELPGLALLCAASVACGKLARVAIKPDHTQFANLYGLVSMPQASGKTPGLRPIMKPLLARQSDLREGYRRRRLEWAGRVKVAGAQIARLEKMAGGADETKAAEIARRIAELKAVEDERPTEPVLIADNATAEAMARLLAQNAGRLGVFTPDGRDILDIAGGRYSKRDEDFAVWLKGHDAESFAYHRANKDAPPFYCDEAVLAAFVAVQPDALKRLGASAAMRESGFLARWLYAIPERRAVDIYPVESVPPEAARAYNKTIFALLDLAPDTDAEGNKIPHVCPLGYSARETWREFHAECRREGEKSPPLLEGCLGKLPEHVARVALVWHLVECAEHGRTPSEIMTAEITRAITLGRCLAAHIRRAVEMLGDTPERSQARDLIPILRKHREQLREARAAEGIPELYGVKPRDVVRGGWAGLEDAEAARKVLDHLELRGWLRRRTIPASRSTPERKTGRDHELYELSPAIWEGV